MSTMAAGEARNRSGERGRRASTPTQIPKKGWLDILYRTFQEVSNDRVMLVAAGVTFYLLLALAPTLAAFVSIYGLFFDPATVQDHAAALSGIVPGGGMEIINEQLSSLASADKSTLGLAFALSLAVALWSANAGVKSLFIAMNVAYDEREERGFVKLTLITLCFTICTLASVIGLIVFNIVFSSFTSATGLSSLPDWIIDSITAAISLVALILFMAALYRFGPSRASPQWKWITPGAVFAGIVIVIVSALFSFYVANFGTYNETYGSLGAAVGFLTWLWLVLIVLIMGGEINSEMEHQTRIDTTTGAPRPMGQRNATMADELGRTYHELRASDDDGGEKLKRDDGPSTKRPRNEAESDDIKLFSGKNSAITAAVVVGALGLALAKRRDT